MKKNMVQIVEVVCGVLLMLAPFHLFKVCTAVMDNGMHMGCFYSGKLVVGMGALIVVCGVVMMVKSCKTLHYVLQGIVLVASLACYVLPHRMIEVGHMMEDGWQIGLCGHEEMACNVVFMPFVTKMVVVLVVVSLLGCVFMSLQDQGACKK